MTSSAAVLRPNPIFFPKPPLPSSSYSAKTLTLNLAGTLTTNPDHHYGPSLRRGQPPLPSDSGDESSNLDRSSFSRTFKIPALRVPSSSTFPLEHRLRGHLLNWPRIRNVARVPGDDLDPRIQTLLRNSEASDSTNVMSPVLYREKLVKDFNCRGFLRFRNLARMSRPKKKRKKERIEGEGKEEKEEEERVYVVREVLGERERDGDDMRGLIGDEWVGGRWRGSTRLLLLDERYKDKGFEELPEAVKV